MIPNLERREVEVREAGGRVRRVLLPLRFSDSNRPDYRDFDSLLPEQQKHVVRAVTSFAYFLHRVFLPDFCRGEGKAWPDPLWPHCQRMAWRYQRAIHPDLLPFDVFPEEQGRHWRIATIAPNRSLKSTVTSEALPLWLIGNYPERIRILGATAKIEHLGEKHIQITKSFIDGSRLYRSVFGALHNQFSPKTWKNSAISVDANIRAVDNTFAFIGAEGSIEGQGCDIAIVDDVQTMANAQTSEVRAKQWQWMQQAFEKRLDPHARVLFMVQTRHADDDFAGRIKAENEQSSTWDYEETPAIAPPWPPMDDDFIDALAPPARLYSVRNLKDPAEWNSRLLCPDVLPLEMLLDEWRPETGRLAFARTRLNKVRDADSKWFGLETVLKGLCRADGGIREDSLIRPLLPAWNVKVGLPKPGSETYEKFQSQGVNIERRVLSIDTAATSVKPGRDPDYTVIMLWGLDTRRGLRVCLDIARFRTGSPKKFREILKEMACAYQPHRIVMETNAMAIWIAKDAQDEIGYPIRGHKKGPEDMERLEEFKSLAESGMLLYCWGDERSAKIMGPFENELDEYPGGSHDDTLVAAVQAQEFLRPRREKVKVYTPESLGLAKRQSRMDVVRGKLDEMKQELDVMLEKVDAHALHY